MHSDRIEAAMSQSTHRWWRVAACVAVPLVFGAWAVQLGRDANWDLQNYHWYNAYAILHWRYDRDVAPAMGQTFFSPLLYVPWYLLGIALPARAMGFVIAAVQSVNLLLLYGIALTTLPIQRALHREFASLAIAAAGMCGGMSLGLLGTTFIDSVVSIGLLGSMLAVVAGREALVSAGPSQAAWRVALAAVPADSIAAPTASSNASGCISRSIFPAMMRETSSMSLTS